ncbi:MAG: TonB family protein [Bacteroidales bacterium]|jgi:TonB family protein|nr:TonB family protein [Bacteroidales bacterium]
MKSNFSSLKLVAVLFLTVCFTMSYAQCDKGNVYGQKGQKSGYAIVFADSNGQHEVPTAAMTLPTFKGGNKAMCRYINKTKKYPVNLKNQKISGTTTVQAKVLKDSTLTDIEVVSSSGYKEFDDEALRVVKSFPKMIPSTQSCEPQDMIVQIPVTFIYEDEVAAEKKKEEMEKMKKDVAKPITLYFENDRPDPRTRTETTNTEYMGLYNNYMSAKNTYITSAGKGLTGAKKTSAENAVENFFNDSIQTGYDRLVKLTNFLVDALQDGHQVEFTISGFASPLSNSDYNKKLSSRRIQSVLNYMARANGGVLAPYINGSKPGLTIHRVPEGQINHNFSTNEVRETVYGLQAAKDRKIIIDRISIR